MTAAPQLRREAQSTRTPPPIRAVSPEPSGNPTESAALSPPWDPDRGQSEIAGGVEDVAKHLNARIEGIQLIDQVSAAEAEEQTYLVTIVGSDCPGDIRRALVGSAAQIRSLYRVTETLFDESAEGETST